MCLAGVFYALWQSPLRVERVTISGADQSLARVATDLMQGSYLGIIPRDSTLFYPAGEIRARIIALHRDIAALSISHSGLTSLSIKVDHRVPIARWCGVASSTLCYFFDAGGLAYATTTTDLPIHPFIIYDASVPQGEVLGSTLLHADAFPRVFDFARSLATFGSPVITISFRTDEVDIYLASSTRITYVLGSEEAAMNALASARVNLPLADGSIDYVDLRFPGKVYVKKK